jgi:hypothetical protein
MLFLIIAAALRGASAQDCTAPPPTKNFSLSSFPGPWYEIARIQTAGGAALQDWCACTELIYTPTPGGNTGDLTTVNSCRFLGPTGFFLNATSYLENMTVPGHWLEVYCPTCPAASYNIIMEGTDSRGVPYAVEYDCSDNAIFGNNYCACYPCTENLCAAPRQPREAPPKARKPHTTHRNRPPLFIAGARGL